jgi:hypothetical protein
MSLKKHRQAGAQRCLPVTLNILTEIIVLHRVKKMEGGKSMSFSFEITVDQPNKILICKLIGFGGSVDDFLKYEQAFQKTWQEHFGNAKIKILIDQRDYKPAVREVTEHVMQRRQQIKDKMLASAIVLGEGVSSLQMHRIVREAHTDEGHERMFTDYDEALQWLKSK